MKRAFVIFCFSVFCLVLCAQVPEIDMVFVQGGGYIMGYTDAQDDDWRYNERPHHLVLLSDFYISKYEVTQELWKAVMCRNPSKYVGDSLPVTCVSWYDARDFVLRLNKMTGKNYRLPTEAEWEYAARGGAHSQHYRYSGSDTLSNVAWWRQNSKRRPHVVGTRQPNELGIYDMSGNVYEWCHDGYEFYETNLAGDIQDPRGNDFSTLKVYRGGCNTSFSDKCRVASRNAEAPFYVMHFIGFRLAMDAQ